MARQNKVPARALQGLAVLLAPTLTVAAHGQNVPLEIRWEGEQPTSINEMTDGGFRKLAYDAATQAYRGLFVVEGNMPERRTIILAYGGHNYPLDLRISRGLRSGVSFTVQFRTLPSCTKGRVDGVSQPATSMPDALNAVLAAGQLLNIATPNDCDQTQRRRVVQSRYVRNVQLGLLSNGLFLVTPEFQSQYRQAALDENRSAASVDAEIAQYAVLEQRLEPIQFGNARQDAMAQRDFQTASEINAAMLARVESNTAVREVYRQQGVTRTSLLSDARTLERATEAGEARMPQ